MTKPKPLPFSVKRTSPLTLGKQVVQGLSRAIRSGYYRPGEQLPTVVQLANALGISTIVIQGAIRKLKATGLVSARPHNGIIVQEPNAVPPLAGHVLQLSRTTNSSSYFAARQWAFQQRLHDARLRLSVVLVDAQETAKGFSTLHSVAEADHVDLAILEGQSWGVTSVLEQRRIPFVHVFSPQLSAHAAGTIAVDEKAILQEFVRHCVDCDIKSVLGVFVSASAAPFEEMTSKAHIRHEVLIGELPVDHPDPENMEVAGLRAMRSYLENVPKLPDLIFFSDDYLARGGLTALLWAGKRIPEDVQVISQTNYGTCPALPKLLTRIEKRPQDSGEAMAKMVIGILNKNGGKRHIVLRDAKLIPGETTLPRHTN